MTADELIGYLDAVKAKGPNKWSAKCPAHADKSPSLSIREGDDGRLLVHCFAGCSIDEITSALGMRVSDLFTDARAPEDKRRMPRSARIDRGALAFRYEMAALDRRLRAEHVLTATRNCDSAALTDETRERLMLAVESAYRDLERADLFEHVADMLRWRAFQERTVSHAA